MLPSETQACASVTSAFLQVRPARDRRAPPRLEARGVSLFGAFRGLRVRSLSRPSARATERRERVPERDRRARRRAAARARSRCRRSIALGRSRACLRVRSTRVASPPSARARRLPPPPRDADRGGVFRRDSTPRGNNTHLRFDEIARSRGGKKKKKVLTITSPRLRLLPRPRRPRPRVSTPPGSQGDSRRRDSARPRREEHPEASFREHQAHLVAALSTGPRGSRWRRGHQLSGRRAGTSTAPTGSQGTARSTPMTMPFTVDQVQPRAARVCTP